MNLNQLIKENSQGVSQEKLDKIMQHLGDKLESFLKTEDDKCSLYKKVYQSLKGGHFNQYFAVKQIEKMYYADSMGKHYAPYWSVEQVNQLYELHKSQINYPFWDFYVTMNMIMSDDYLLLKQWFPELTSEKLTEKVVESTINWLNDEDNPYGTEKAWGYFNN